MRLGPERDVERCRVIEGHSGRFLRLLAPSRTRNCSSAVRGTRRAAFMTCGAVCAVCGARFASALCVVDGQGFYGASATAGARATLGPEVAKARSCLCAKWRW